MHAVKRAEAVLDGVVFVDTGGGVVAAPVLSGQGMRRKDATRLGQQWHVCGTPGCEMEGCNPRRVERYLSVSLSSACVCSCDKDCAGSRLGSYPGNITIGSSTSWLNWLNWVNG